MQEKNDTAGKSDNSTAASKQNTALAQTNVIGGSKIEGTAEEVKRDVKEDFKDENIAVEPVLDNDGNEIGGEG